MTGLAVLTRRLHLHFFPLLFFIQSAMTAFDISILPSATVREGDSVIIRCNTTSQNRQSLNLFISHGEKSVAEGCRTYTNNNYSLICVPKGPPKNVQYVDLTIPNVTWEDRGKWSCLFDGEPKTKELEVLSPGLLTNPATVKAFRKRKDGREIQISKSSLGGLLEGRGIRTSPYDLRPGYIMEMVCTASPGYPSTKFGWNYTSYNDVIVPIGDKTKGFQIESRYYYPSSKRKSSNSTLRFDCNSTGLLGLNRIYCYAVNESQFDGNVNQLYLQKFVYILCTGGDKALSITSVELGAIIFGSLFSVVFIVFGCIMVRRNLKSFNYSSNLPTDEAGVGLHV